MTNALYKAQEAAKDGFWQTAESWAAIAQAEALDRIASALEAQQSVPTQRQVKDRVSELERRAAGVRWVKEHDW